MLEPLTPCTSLMLVVSLIPSTTSFPLGCGGAGEKVVGVFYYTSRMCVIGKVVVVALLTLL